MKQLRLNGFSLKIIAMITMLIDHIGLVFFPEVGTFRLIGRLAFPIFCFLLVEGFYHTSNVKKYMGRLLLFAVVSEYPFDLLANMPGNYMKSQNIFFTLFLGLVAIYLMDQADRKYPMEFFVKSIIDVVIAIVFSSIAMILKTDYNVLGVFYIVIFYLYRGRHFFIFLCIEIITIYFCGGLYVKGHMIRQNFAGFAVLLTALYNGERGPKIKYLFYIFYPLHILVLVGLYYLLNGQLPTG
ncbi:MAG: TraX family protein [bacterium]|nr:TraX family protein [bacterium]